MTGRVITGDEVKVGDVIYAINNVEDYEKYLSKLDEVKKELKLLTEGHKTIVFYMTREYRYNFSKNTKILYKRVVIGFHPVRRSPEYKSDYINVTEGRVRTANPEEIAFLDFSKGFVREANRELSPMEKERKDIQDLRLAKEQLAGEIDKIKEQLREQKAVKEIVKNEPADSKGQKENS